MEAFEIFAMCPPGLEAVLAEEARSQGFDTVAQVPGGITFMGNWPEVWRANLQLRGAGRVLARIGAFRAFHLAQLDKRARKFDWGAVLRPDVPVKVECVTRKSKIYHAGAATERIERAITGELGAPIARDASLTVKVRIEDNLCTFSLDTSGESLHKRGHKVAVNKAPMRETMAALFLRQCGYDGQMPVLDPMCGSGTFVIEAAEMALGLAPGRTRRFAFEELASFEAAAWDEMRGHVPQATPLRFFGHDRDQGAITMSQANADRAGVAEVCQFACQPVSALEPPDTAPGLIIVNPPYGARISNKKLLYGLYASLGERLKTGFKGWRFGIITTEAGLARSTGLDLLPPGPPIPHGGLKVKLFQAKL